MGRVLPISFNTEMLQALLDGRKTVTRRVIKSEYKDDEMGFIVNIENGWRVEKIGMNEKTFCIPRYIDPPYQPGDILYVRETWFYEQHMEKLTAGEPDLPSGRYSHRYIYEADNPDYPVNVGVGAAGWQQPANMPEEAARIWLKVTDVKPERLHDITGTGILAEGVFNHHHPFTQVFWKYLQRMEFKKLWNSAVRKPDIKNYGWAANPSVWVIGFERCEKL